MRAHWMCLVVAPVMLGLGACSTDNGSFTDDIDTLWGGESRADKEQRAELERRRSQKVPVQSVGSVEIGRTGDGILITAHGTAPGLGYALPALQARRDGKPAEDGYIEYDFVASEPYEGFNLPKGNSRTRALRADLPVNLRQLRGAKGLRVMALRGAIQIDF